MVARKKSTARKSTSSRTSKTTAARKTTARKPKARATKKPVVDPTTQLTAGQRVWVLEDVPFGMRFPGLVYDKSRKATLFIGTALSPVAALYAAKDYSLARWLEDDINGRRSSTTAHDVAPMTPRADQQEDINAINRSIEAGHRGFFLTSQTGTGKTIVSVMAAKHAAAKRVSGRPANILVIANRPAAICIPDFRRTIHAVGDDGHRWLVTTVDRVHKAADMKVVWDVVIVDEAHGFRSTSTRRSKSLAEVTKAKNEKKDVPFTIWMTATPAHDPTELTYLSSLLAEVNTEKVDDWVGDKFITALERNGFHISKGRYGAQWTEDPSHRAADVALFRSWLTDSAVPRTLYRAAPWGQAPIDLAAVELDPERLHQYNTNWAEFQDELEIARKAGKGDKGRAAVLRWRQKALMLRIPEVVEWALAQLELDNQVVIYTDFVGVGAEPITEALAEKVGVARLFGTDYDTASELAAFYRGDSPVAVTTMSASINLQSGAIGADGKAATAAPRVGAMAAPLYSGIKGRQVVGRTHRDGQVSPWVVMAAEGTVEERVGRVMIERFAASDGLAGADTSALREVAGLLGASWLDVADDD